MKRILAALDLTAHGDRAFERANRIRRQHGAELVVTHVLPGSISGDSVRASAEQRLHSYKAHDDASITYRIREGDPGRELAALVAELKADLVVLGLHHDRPILDHFIETVAYCAIGQCGCPVLIVKERCEGPYSRVLMPTDFSPSARRALHAAIELAPQAAFHLLHVYETPFPAFIRFSDQELKELEEQRLAQIRRDLKDQMHAFLKRGGDLPFPSAQIILDRNATDVGITKAMREIQPDLLAMGMSGFGFAALVGSRTQAYLSGLSCDILVTA